MSTPVLAPSATPGDTPKTARNPSMSEIKTPKSPMQTSFGCRKSRPHQSPDTQLTSCSTRQRLAGDSTRSCHRWLHSSPSVPPQARKRRRQPTQDGFWYCCNRKDNLSMPPVSSSQLDRRPTPKRACIRRRVQPWLRPLPRLPRLRL